MSGTATLTAIGTETISASNPDIEAIFQSAAAAIATTSAADKHTYNGNTLPDGDAKSVLFIPASVTATVTVPGNYAYVVVAQGAHVNLIDQTYRDQQDFSYPIVVGDGFNFDGIASVVANGGGASNITDGSGYGQPGGPVSTVIHTAGTGTLKAGFDPRFTIDSGANVTVSAVSPSHSGNAITVNGGATATITQGRGTLEILSGAKTKVSIGQGGGDQVTIGVNLGTAPTVPLTPPTAPSVPSSAAAATPAAPVFTNQIVVYGDPPLQLQPYYWEPNSFVVNDPTSVNLIALGVIDAVTVAAGASTIFGQASNLIDASGAAGVFFVGGADTGTAGLFNDEGTPPPVASTASTVLGGAGNSTLFATAGDVFNLGVEFGAAQANVFVGGTAASTINANAGGGDFFGGSHGDQYNAGTSRSQIFVGDGGADTINAVGAGLVTPVIYAQAAEQLLLVSSAASTVVGFTHDGVINAAGTTADNAIFAGYGIGGNQTLIGSTSSFDGSGSATHDTFVVGANPAGTASALTIDNWHAGDVFFLTGFTPADTGTMDTAIANDLANGASGDLTFTLSDNSTITFVANHPTNYTGDAAF